ncbi:glycosyltransferase family 61 protein [Candidatus Dependentiae bacterium]|nr:glycosyltransferase family 61 protein [Candidatus Dependentiae bacterium]
MKNYKPFRFLLLIISYNFVLDAKKIIWSNQRITKERSVEKNYDEKWLNKNAWFKINSLEKILENRSDILYKEIFSIIKFDYPEFALSSKFPHKGYFHSLFFLKIFNGRVQGERGYVFINGQLPREMARAERFDLLYGIPKTKEKDIRKISGRVAVIAQHGSDNFFANYYHWVCEVLGRLALLEIAGIEYDWLYVGKSKKFMKETLDLWGIDTSKIIEPINDNFCVEANELIVPSMVINTSCGHKHAGNFQHPLTLQYVSEKLLNAYQVKNIDINKFSKRIFISRNDSFNSRKILNENEVFELFKTKGFERYELSCLSVAEQIVLFHNADIVVAEHGASLTNILFCKPNTKIIELFQAYVPVDYWWLSNVMKLNYFPIKTMPVDVDYFIDCRSNISTYINSATSKIAIKLEFIKDIIDRL